MNGLATQNTATAEKTPLFRVLLRALSSLRLRLIAVLKNVKYTDGARRSDAPYLTERIQSLRLLPARAPGGRFVPPGGRAVIGAGAGTGTIFQPSIPRPMSLSTNSHSTTFLLRKKTGRA